MIPASRNTHSDPRCARKRLRSRRCMKLKRPTEGFSSSTMREASRSFLSRSAFSFALERATARDLMKACLQNGQFSRYSGDQTPQHAQFTSEIHDGDAYAAALDTRDANRSSEDLPVRVAGQPSSMTRRYQVPISPFRISSMRPPAIILPHQSVAWEGLFWRSGVGLRQREPVRAIQPKARASATSGGMTR